MNQSGYVTFGVDRIGNVVCRSRRYCSMLRAKQGFRHCKNVGEWQKAVDIETDLQKATDNDAARLDRLSILAAELKILITKAALSLRY